MINTIVNKKIDLDQYKSEGYTGPIQFCSPDQAEIWRKEFYQVLGQDEKKPKKANHDLSAFHHDHLWAYNICTNPVITDSISQILNSEDLFLWAMHFWYKEPGNRNYIPWHQDKNYWPMNPAINATAWIALGESKKENGCLRLIPGTHKNEYKHEELDKLSSLGEGIKDVNESKALDLEMEPGQVVFFNESIIHGSKANDSNIARVACSVRYTIPSVSFAIDEWGGNKERIKTFLVKGEDRFHYNDSITGIIPN